MEGGKSSSSECALPPRARAAPARRDASLSLRMCAMTHMFSCR